MQHGSDPHWYDDDAGPMVRLFALTRGRTRGSGELFDLIALISAVAPGDTEASHRADGPFTSAAGLAPEAVAILDLCRPRPLTVAEVAADCDLPVGVVRVLLGDLFDAGLIQVGRPVLPAMLPNERLLREVIHGLQAL
ncbi:DUF742 domain-containing protein [Streptacidiphilus sp. N1-12]|uniref:DUF742 domain-containing protein n=2 Tax=Streptacidiphilus alkalitolerans TaxID=3342712 RepID=A0ABV6WXN5_9ACTN